MRSCGCKVVRNGYGGFHIHFQLFPSVQMVRQPLLQGQLLTVYRTARLLLDCSHTEQRRRIAPIDRRHGQRRQRHRGSGVSRMVERPMQADSRLGPQRRCRTTPPLIPALHLDLHLRRHLVRATARQPALTAPTTTATTATATTTATRHTIHTHHPPTPPTHHPTTQPAPYQPASGPPPPDLG